MDDVRGVESNAVSLWGPRTIGWLTLVLEVMFIPPFGVASGFTLASLNWHRMGIRHKARTHLLVGLGLAIASAVVYRVWQLEFPLRESQLGLVGVFIYLLYVFLIVTYLHKTTEAGIAQFQTNHHVRPASTLSAVGIAVAASIVMLGVQFGVNYGIALARTPKLKSTAALVPGDTPSIIGEIHPWIDEPIEGRKLVLCELVTSTRLDPYDCELTRFEAGTDTEGGFQLAAIPVGEYLVFYDSGLGGFNKAVATWAGKRIELGDYLWLAEHEFFAQDYEFHIYYPAGEEINSFYYSHTGLTLMVSGSPFFVAHDMKTASAYEGEIYPWEAIPDGVFIPTMIKVAEGYTSEVEFKVLYYGD